MAKAEAEEATDVPEVDRLSAGRNFTCNTSTQHARARGEAELDESSQHACVVREEYECFPVSLASVLNPRPSPRHRPPFTRWKLPVHTAIMQAVCAKSPVPSNSHLIEHFH